MSSVTVLKAFLEKVDIPFVEKRKRSFFDISGFPHDELVISAWYAYFFRVDEDHGLGDLFMRSLLSIINEQTSGEFSLNDFVVDTEVTTTNKKRIDILIKGVGKDEGKYIIIENKVYHWLDNDLDDYWNFCETVVSKKIGIVFSLGRMSMPDSILTKYVNVFHKDLLHRILLSTNKELINTKYLPDFSDAINNLYKDYNMDSEVQFYYENMAACNLIYNVAEKAYEFAVDHIRIAGEHLGLHYSGRADYYKYLYKKANDGVFYTIIFDNLFEEPKTIYIVIELDKKGIEHISEIDARIGEKKVKENKLNYKPDKREGLWLHYAGQAYTLELEDLKRLSVFVAGKIKNDFNSIFQDIHQVIVENE